MSWCTIVDKVSQLTNDVDLIYTRIGGRVNVDDLATLEPFITMTDVQVNHFTGGQHAFVFVAIFLRKCCSDNC
jgi:hypothetical protein